MAQEITRRKLIDAALKCIAEVGIEATTNRMIASKAGVNGALVNYHFGSLEKLLDAAIRESVERYLRELVDGGAAPATGNGIEDGEGPKEDAALRRLLDSSLRDAVASPLVTRSYMRDALVRGACEGPFIEGLRAFLEEESEGLARGLRAADPAASKLALAQMLACVLFFGLMPDFFGGFLDLDLEEPAAREAFVDSLLSRFRS